MNQNLETRITEAAARKLGVPVQIVRWDKHRTGADVPVFAVPDTHRVQAQSLGLTVAN